MSDQRQETNCTQLKDKFYETMSKFNNKQWKEFARKRNGLNLPEHEIDSIGTDHIHDSREQKYQMLASWQRKNGDQATVKCLDSLVKKILCPVTHNPGEPDSNDTSDGQPMNSERKKQQQIPSFETNSDSYCTRRLETLIKTASPKFSPESQPKMTGASKQEHHEHESVSNKAQPSVQMPPSPLGVAGMRDNIHIHVHGGKGVGIQNNYYYGGKKQEN